MTYRIYTRVNYADTCRDPDDIHIHELGVTSDLEKAKQFATDYIRNNFYHKNTELKEFPCGYSAFDVRSYGEEIIVQKLKELE